MKQSNTKTVLKLVVALFLFSVQGMFAQTVTMPGDNGTGSTSSCSMTLLDPGGTGNYANNHECTYTICSNIPGQTPRITFTSFATEAGWDYVYVYNGNSTASPLMGSYSGNTLPPVLTASGNCLTIYFDSDGSNVAAGFSANITCVTPPPPNNQDCLGAIPVCQNVYNQAVAYSGTGNNPNEINAGPSCLNMGERNDVWYQFTVQQSGNLAFSITPNTITDDYDWAVYNLTNNNCGDIFSNAALEVSCNYSGVSGVTGPNGLAGVQNNAVIPVTAGQTYAVNVSQFTTSTAGYSLNFGASSAVIFDNVPPSINSLVATPACGATAFSFNFSENVLCSTVSTGDFTLSGPGGPYTVTGISGPACVAGAPSENTFTVTTTPPITTSGTYSLCLVTGAGSVTDLCGNVAPAGCFNFTIAGPTVTATPTGPNCSVGTGTITAVAAGGAGGPFTYSLNGGAFQASGTFTGLAAGNYTVTTQGAGGCRGEDAVNVITIPAPVTVTLTPTAATCGNNNGSITTNVAGGTPGYTYAWSPSGTGANPTGLATGNYTVTVTDTRGCTGTASTTITQTGAVTSTFTGSANQCLNGNSFTFTNTGTAAATHAWTFPGGTPGTSAAVSPAGVTWAAAGTYTVTHTVTLGSCTSTTTLTIVVFPQPNGPALAAVHPTCGNPNGTINVTAATGGTAPYQYSLNGGAFTALTNYTGQGPGTYTVTVRDANGCTNTSTITLTNVPGPTALALTPATAHCAQSDGSIAIGAVTGGTAGYTYSFNNPAGPFTATSPITGLAPGTYSVTVRDNNGCIFTTTATVANAPGPAGPNASSTNASCGGSNGTVTLAPPTTGTGPYTYSFNGSGFTTTVNYTGLAANTYTYVVRDNFGCTLNGSITVNNNAGPTAVVLTPGNASCGTANGTITIGAVTGGTAAYQYSLDGGGFTATISYTGLAAGTHTVIVRDVNGCTFTATTTINNNAGPTAVVLTPGNASCGTANGTITIGAVTGGTAAYQYSVDGGAFAATTNITGLTAGTHTVIVRDANGCTFTATTTINNSAGPTALALTPANATCGGSNGSFTIGAVTGGTGPYTYSVNGGAFTGTTNHTGLVPNTYTVTVRDNNGCTFNTTVVVGSNPGPTAVVLTPVNSTCGTTNGSFTIGAVTGGTAAYTYSVAPGPAGFTSTLSYPNLAAGTFTVTVRDANGCTFTANTTVANTPGPTAVALTPVNTSCGASTGSLTIGAVTGGTSAYTYSVSPGPAGFNATLSFTNLAAATYTVIVRDANGCTFTATSVVGNNPGPTALALTPGNASCGSSNGTITVGAVTGGTAAYQYSLDGGAFTATTSYTGLAAGTHTVIVRDANGCTFTATTTINNASGPTAVVLTPTNASCGTANGSFAVGAVTGGTAAYQYSMNGSPFTATTNYTGLAAGTYTVIVRDANGCTFTANTTINNNAGPTAVVLTPANATCGAANGTITVGAVTGGAGTNVYSLDGGAFTATTTYTGLAAGTHTVIVRDVNNCTFTATVVIANTPGPTAVVLTPVNSTCGNANGSFAIGAVTGGTAAYTYSVAPGPAGFTSTVSYPNLAAGTYTVTVRDANGCTFTANTTVINTPGPTAVALTPVNTSCGGTSGTLTIGAVTGGTSAYTYSVSPGPAGFNGTTGFTNLSAATYTVIVQDANGCTFTATSVVGNNPGPTAVVLTPTNSTCGASNGSFTIGAVTGGAAAYQYSVDGGAFSATTNYTGLAAGTHTVIVRDANGCTFTATTTINNSGGPTAVVLTPTAATCGAANGSFTIGAVTGGAAAYQYSVNGGAFSATTNYPGLTAGTYTVVVRDANGCTFNTTVSISNSGGPTAQAVSSTNSACSSNTGTVTLGATTGGFGVMTYSFDGSAFTGTTNYTNVAAGTYVVIVRDANGCQFSTTVTVGTVAGPTALALTPGNSTCGNSNGTITIGAVTGGTAAYQYSLDGGAFSATTSLTGLAAGTHTVVVRDANGCTFTATTTIANTPGPTAFAVSGTSSTCGNSNGTATAGAVTTSGSTTFQYSINGGALGSTTTFTGLAAATYTLLVQDANGCTLTNTVTITNLAGPTAQALTPTNATCGNSNGAVTIGATTGGNGAITYSFNGGAFSGTTSYTGLPAGTHTVIAQDANNCQFTQTVVVANLPGPTAVALTPVSATCGGSNGSVAIGAVTGGTAAYTYSFNGSPFTATTSYTGLIAGTYTVIVQDANNCQFTQTVAVTNSSGPTAVVLTPGNSTCGNSNGTITVGAVTGGSGTITYSLDGGAFTSTINYTGLAAGTHTITVRDVNGCTFAQTTTIADTPGPTAVVLTPTNSTCGNANGSFAIGAVTGGTSAYTYSVNGGAFTATTNYTGLAAGTHTVIVRDANNCQYTQTVVIANTPGPTAFAVSGTSSTCGNPNGTATAGAVTTSGSTTFQYSINGGALGSTTTFTGLAAATYTLLVQDANGCTFTNTVTITDLAGPTAQVLTPTNATCGNSNGAVTIGATTGGNGLITYNFNGGAFSGTTSYTGLPAGTYTVIAQDANNCQFTQTTVVSNLPGPTAVALTPVSATCGGSNGSVTIGAVTGGTAAFTYSFNGSPFTATTSYTGLLAGTYTVVVQDANSCQFTQTVTVNNSGGPTAVVLTPANSTCGNPNGSIAVGAVTGGSGTITYALNGGAFGPTINYTGLLAGTYTITVQDVNGCTFNQTTTISDTPGPTAVVLTPTNSTCGSANGSFVIGAVTGGTSAYTYSVNGGAFTGTVNQTNLMAGTYTVVVQDANSCQFTQTVAVANTPGPTAVALTPVNSTCGNNNGQVNVGAVSTTGSTVFQYSIDGGVMQPGTNFPNLSAATHTIVVQDANGCQFTQTVNVLDTPGPTAQAATTTNSTCGNANGVITIGATTGGTAAYTWSLDGSPFTAATSYTVTAGTHTVVVRDVNLCTFTVTATVNNTAGPTAVALSTTGSNCGNPNGTVTVGAVTGGTVAYQYAINGGAPQSGTVFTGLLPGTYTVNVTDANSCSITNTVTVVNLGSPVAVVASQTNVSCNGGNNGAATITASGGSGSGYVYTLNTGQSNGTGIFSGLAAAAYTVTLTDGAGCTATTTFTITQPAVLNGSILTQTNVSCFSGSNGAVTVTETGGTGPFTYALNGGAFGSTATFTGLSATSYTVTVRDNLGCTSNVPVTITQPTAISLAFTSVNANCTDDNGTATVTPSGGTPGYSQSWSGAGGTGTTTNPVIAGTYTVTVTDANNCTQTGSTTIGVTPGGTVTISSAVNVTCNGANDGTITVSNGGGATAPFNYLWSPAAGVGSTVTNLAPGTYSVTVTDAHGCTAGTSTTITQPLAMTVSFTSINVSCNGGSDATINSTVGGGTMPYTYSWSPGAFNTPSITGIPVGSYTLIATDAHGCTITGTRNITQPTALTITPTITQPHCGQADGSATVVGTGGAGGYQFSLNGGAFGPGSFTSLSATTYTITIRDANNCTANLPLTLVDQSGPSASITASTNVSCNGGTNGSLTVTASGGTTPYYYLWSPSAAAQTTQTANNLPAGVHSVIVTDSAGCSASAALTITQPAVLQINATGTDPVCNGQSNGTGSASAFGGTIPYTFQWAVLPIQNTANATGLPPGVHNVTVTDANMCTATTSVNLNNPPLLTVAITLTNLLCFNVCNGSALATTTNGTPPFLYAWNDPNNQTTQTATGLCAGNYTLNVTDFKGCTASASATITQPTLLTSSIVNPVNVTCAGLCNGSGAISASGGTGAYTYSWSNSTASAVNTGLCVGSYTGTVTDANGCASQSVLNIVAPNPLIVNATGTNASCNNICDGTATATFSGGTAPYTFLWQPSLAQTFNAAALCDGTHTVTVTDNNSCVTTATVVITEPAALTASTAVSNNNFCGQSNGTAQVMTSGGTPNFTYSWTNMSGAQVGTTSFIGSLPGGPYSIDVTDANGCTVNAIANVIDIPAPTLTILDTTDITCFGLHNGMATIQIQGGTAPVSPQTWLMPGTMQPNAVQSGTGSGTNLYPGNNVFTVVDAAGCVSSITIPISEPTLLVSATNNITNVTCNGLSNGSATMLLNGGTQPYTYQWTDPTLQTSATALSLAAGTYTCNVTDANGCPTTQSVTITEPLPLAIINNTVSNVTCNNAANGMISVTIIGGTPAYTYGWAPNSNDFGPNVSGLAPGIYQLQVTDSKGCMQNSAYSIIQPPPFTVNAITVPSTCSNANASIQLAVTGATPNYTYSWNTPTPQTTQNATNLAAPGTYNCLITDANGCITTFSTSVTDEPAPTIDSVVVTNVTCNGLNNGTAMVYPKPGGSANFTYLWSQGGTQQFVTGLNAGTYNVVVTDDNMCTVTGIATITQPFPLTLVASEDQVACNGQTLGVYAAAGNGTPGYVYTWSGAGAGLTNGGNHNVLFTNTTSSAVIQTFNISVTDTNNCPARTDQFNVTILPAISISAPNVTGCLSQEVELVATASGGDGVPYTFTWGTTPLPTVQTGDSSEVAVNVTSLNATPYSLVVSDGCSTPATVTVTVNANPTPSAALIGVNTIGCADLEVVFSGSGGSNFPFCTYEWSFGDGSSGSDSSLVHTYTNEGLQSDSLDVQLIVTSLNGCKDTVVMNNYVIVYPRPVAEFTFNPLNTTELDPTISFYNQSQLGSTFSWNFGEPVSGYNVSSLEHPVHSYINAGTYDVTLVATSDKGCVDQVIHPIYIEPEFAIYVPNAFSPNEDLKNQVFFPQGIGIDEKRYTMYIYDRWGEMIYETKDWSKGWDGTAKGGTNMVQQDVYVYRIIVFDLKGNKHDLSGHVTVVR